VGLTRARYSLFVFGNAKSLRKNDQWGELVTNAETKGFLVSYDPGVLDPAEKLYDPPQNLLGIVTQKRPGSMLSENPVVKRTKEL
jgi:hypothetical protein